MTDDVRRLGRFRITNQLLRGDLDCVRAILKDVVVVRCEQMFHSDGFEYIGIHPAFDVLPDDMEAPLYRADVTRNERLDDILTGATTVTYDVKWVAP
jgi:hypothetical protein